MNDTMPRRAFLAIATTALATGCARDRPVVLDRQAMVGIKRIGLPSVGVPRSPDVRVLNAISDKMAGFGLIGAIGAMSGMVVRGNRSDALVRMMAAQGFDPGPALTSMLAAALGAKGFAVVPLSADTKRNFMPSVAAAPEYDAVLDCYVPTYGFMALNDSDAEPFRATIAVQARLVVGGTGTVLMQDGVVISGGPARAGAEPAAGTVAPPPPSGVLALRTFPSFSDAEKEPAAAIDTLRAVFEAAAEGVVRRIS